MRLRRRAATVLATVLATNVLLLTGCSFQDTAESALRWFYRDSSSTAAGADRPASEPASPSPSEESGTGGQGSEGAQPGSETADSGSGTDAGGVPASEGDAPGADSGPFTSYTLRPVNEAAKDPALSKFVADLKKTVAARDVDALMAAVDPDVEVGAGAAGGRDAFRQRWKLDSDAKDSPLWPVLGDMLSLGGAFAPDDADVFVLPYASAHFPSALDPGRYLVVTASGVNVRTQPSLDAPAIGTASYLVVRRRAPAQGETLPTISLGGRVYRWAKVQLPSGQIGYVADKYLWNPAARTVLRKTADGWRVASIAAGD